MDLKSLIESWRRLETPFNDEYENGAISGRNDCADELEALYLAEIRASLEDEPVELIFEDITS